jgi:hypothetical protein
MGQPPTCSLHSESAWWRDRTASLYSTTPLGRLTRRTCDFNKPAEAEADGPPYEGRHETSGHQSCRNAPRRRRGRHPTVSDGCLVLVAPVSSDVFAWTADSLLHTHNWRMGKLRARRCSLEPRRTLRDTWTNFLSCVKQQNFRKQSLARETRFEMTAR